MIAFTAFLCEKLERYIKLRRSLGYAFNKQAGTLQAFVRHVERSQLDAPATRTMALDFVLSFLAFRVELIIDCIIFLFGLEDIFDRLVLKNKKANQDHQK